MYHSNFKELEDIKSIAEKTLNYDDLLESVNSILNEKWCESIKLGSEVEDNKFEELSFVKNTFNKKLRFKIGGCGAKNDIRVVFQNKVDVITLPMAESRYAIENFLENIEIYRKTQTPFPILAMNIETMTIANNLPDVKDLLSNFSSFTIGRSDLSGSMNVNVNDPLVDKKISEILDFIHHNFPTAKISIGGKITPKAAIHLYENFKDQFNFLNTKFIYILPDENIEVIVLKALELEILLYALFYYNDYRNKDEFIDFAKNNMNRMNS
ncbi:MAG TPA: hypothetical protein PK449_06245 [Exilispira sp.]|nr:hypothetical protein [Exilispira sp.]